MLRALYRRQAIRYVCLLKLTDVLLTRYLPDLLDGLEPIIWGAPPLPASKFTYGRRLFINGTLDRLGLPRLTQSSHDTHEEGNRDTGSDPIEDNHSHDDEQNDHLTKAGSSRDGKVKAGSSRDGKAGSTRDGKAGPSGDGKAGSSGDDRAGSSQDGKAKADSSRNSKARSTRKRRKTPQYTSGAESTDEGFHPVNVPVRPNPATKSKSSATQSKRSYISISSGSESDSELLIQHKSPPPPSSKGAPKPRPAGLKRKIETLDSAPSGPAPTFQEKGKQKEKVRIATVQCLSKAVADFMVSLQSKRPSSSDSHGNPPSKRPRQDNDTTAETCSESRAPNPLDTSLGAPNTASNDRLGAVLDGLPGAG